MVRPGGMGSPRGSDGRSDGRSGDRGGFNGQRNFSRQNDGLNPHRQRGGLFLPGGLKHLLSMI